MAFGIDLDSIIAKLGESPAVAKAMEQFTEVRNGIIAAMNHFNQRFDTLDSKADKIIYMLEHPSDVRPAADDGLLKLLAENGQDMQLIKPEPMPVVNEVKERAN